MRVLLSTWGSRGDVEPLAGLAVRLRELGAQARVCAPPDEDFTALLARVGVPLVPLGTPLLAGPGAIVAVMLFAKRAGTAHWAGIDAVALAQSR